MTMTDPVLDRLLSEFGQGPVTHREYRAMKLLEDYQQLLASIKIGRVGHHLSLQAFERVTAHDEIWRIYTQTAVKNAVRDMVPDLCGEVRLSVKPFDRGDTQTMIYHDLMVLPLTPVMRDERTRLSTDSGYVREKVRGDRAKDLKQVPSRRLRSVDLSSGALANPVRGKVAGNVEARIQREGGDDPAAA